MFIRINISRCALQEYSSSENAPGFFFESYTLQLFEGLGIPDPYEVLNNAFLVMELKTDGLKKVSGTVEYPEEFNAV